MYAGKWLNVFMTYLYLETRHVHRHFGGQVLKPKKRAPIAKMIFPS